MVDCLSLSLNVIVQRSAHSLAKLIADQFKVLERQAFRLFSQIAELLWNFHLLTIHCCQFQLTNPALLSTWVE